MRKEYILSLVIIFCVLPAIMSAQSKKKPAGKPSATAAHVPAAALAEGKAIYMQYCVSCHQADGGGMPNMNPPLIKTSYVRGDKSKFISVLLNGMSHQEIDGESYHNVMPPFDYLSDKEIANVLTFVRNSFGNSAGIVTEGDVKLTREKK